MLLPEHLICRRLALSAQRYGRIHRVCCLWETNTEPQLKHKTFSSTNQLIIIWKPLLRARRLSMSNYSNATAARLHTLLCTSKFCLAPSTVCDARSLKRSKALLESLTKVNPPFEKHIFNLSFCFRKPRRLVGNNYTFEHYLREAKCEALIG